MRSFTLSMFASVILSPGTTSARAGAASITATTASAPASLRVAIIGSPSLERDGAAGVCLGGPAWTCCEPSASLSVLRSPAPRP